MDILARIKRLVVSGQYLFTDKAGIELDLDGLVEQDAIEAILNAQEIKKTIRSNSPQRTQRRETLYIIEGLNYSGTRIYTKGKIARQAGREWFYVLISAKRSIFGA